MRPNAVRCLSQVVELSEGAADEDLPSLASKPTAISGQDWLVKKARINK